MAVQYKLILAGDTPVNQVAERAFASADDGPASVAPRVAVDLKADLGFDVTIAAGRDRSFDWETDDGSWEWELDQFVRLTFRLDKAADPRWAVANVLAVVGRVLDTGPEDATFDFNGDILLFVRRDGVLTKHRRDTWWERYSAGEPCGGGAL
jgi:hypothetical protein